MTQYEMIEMAKQAEFDLDGTPNMLYTVRGNYAQLNAFAKLVAAKAIAELESQEPVKYEHKAYTMPPQENT